MLQLSSYYTKQQEQLYKYSNAKIKPTNRFTPFAVTPKSSFTNTERFNSSLFTHSVCMATQIPTRSPVFFLS